MAPLIKGDLLLKNHTKKNKQQRNPTPLNINLHLQNFKDKLTEPAIINNCYWQLPEL